MSETVTPTMADAPTLRTEGVHACPVCQGAGAPLHGPLRDLVYGVPGNWALQRCSNRTCGAAWLDPRPIAQDLGLAYANYATHGNSGRPATRAAGAALGRLIDAAMVKSFWISRSRRSRQRLYLDDLPPGRVLDVGCGSGVVLRLLTRDGWRAEGQEVDPLAAREARRYSGCEVHEGPLPALDLATGTFDALTLSHVIEHVINPVNFLRECLTLLKPGGRLVAVTPNVGSLGHLLFGADWRGLEPPRHIQVLSVGAIALAAANAGLAVERVFTTSAFGAYFCFASEQIARKREPGTPHRGEWARALRFKTASTMLRVSEFGAGEELVLIARRP